MFRLAFISPHIAYSIRQTSTITLKSNHTLTNKGLKSCCEKLRAFVRRPYSTAGVEAEQNAVQFLKQRLAENKEKNILVYSCLTKSGIMLNVTGVLASIFLVGTAYNSFLIFDSVKFKSQKFDNDGSMQSFIFRTISSEKFKYSVCSIVTIIGVGILATTFFFTMRSVNKIYLLKGSKSIGIITDGLFGKPFSYELALGETNFSSTRMNRSSIITFKNKKHYLYFLVNNVEGKFHEKQLFDHVICGAR